MEGISHTTFIVRVLAKASLFFKNIFEAEEVYSSGEKIFSIARENIFSHWWSMGCYYGRGILSGSYITI
jgi:catechol 2,3-dioxygenase-like lactoylglutathione lyase family enzyme